jgi:hypothetical protein
MAGYIDHAHAVTNELAQVPWWCWLTLLAMIIVKFLPTGRREPADEQTALYEATLERTAALLPSFPRRPNG